MRVAKPSLIIRYRPRWRELWVSFSSNILQFTLSNDQQFQIILPSPLESALFRIRFLYHSDPFQEFNWEVRMQDNPSLPVEKRSRANAVHCKHWYLGFPLTLWYISALRANISFLKNTFDVIENVELQLWVVYVYKSVLFELKEIKKACWLKNQVRIIYTNKYKK